MKLFLLLLAISLVTDLARSGLFCAPDSSIYVTGEQKLIFITFFPLFWPGKNPVLQCMGTRGFCRSSCRKDEQPYFYCRTYQTCCLQPYVRISLTSADDNTAWSHEKQWPKIP
ncbi:beta-defensin 119 [Peromyscus californicus insignis]|uniref:beta-defensin 119 n=1 Tax=Peromyscus californicus insignis TaxID=564181 RepID=UPI0022A66417|nr:beta-defensin 119 [Peromyscus californicus insignis]